MSTVLSSPNATKGEIRRWTFYPEKPRKKRIRREKSDGAWVAPEHARIGSQMERDWPRNDRGEPLRDKRGKILVLDKRPTIMVPPRETYQAF